MKLYRKIKPYPNSNTIPEIIKAYDEHYYTQQPQLHPDFWEELKVGKLLFTSKDDVEIENNTQVFLVDDKLNIHPIVVDERYANSDGIFFKYFKKAQEYITSLIQISIVNEVINGENIPLYGCLITNSHQLCETTSLALWKRMNVTPKPSDKWKYFRTKEERAEYIKMNEFIYNRKTIQELNKYVISCNTERGTLDIIINKLQQLMN